MTSSSRTIKKVVVGRRPKAGAVDQDSRAAILRAARTIFARRGYEGASTREVAEAARVNNAMIYYHFKDKVGLYRAVLADSFAAFDRVWEHDIFSSSASARQKIHKYVEELVRFQHANEELRRILSLEFALCGRNMKWLSEKFFSSSYEKLARIINDGIRSGEMKKIDAALGLSALVGMVVHTFILRPIAEYISGKKMDLEGEQFSRFVTGMFFDGLGTDGTKHPKRCRRGMAI